MDDGLARAAALAMGITITGTLGVLKRAKHAGLLVAVRPILDEMQANGLRVGAAGARVHPGTRGVGIGRAVAGANPAWLAAGVCRIVVS